MILTRSDCLRANCRSRVMLNAPFEQYAAESNHILNGGFLDRGVLFGYVNVINPVERKAYLWGDGKETTHWITYNDTALYTAAAGVTI